MQLRRVISILMVVCLAASLVGCKNDVRRIMSPQELRDLLSEAGGWVPLVLPDSKYRPGSIILVNDADGQPTWVDHLDGCINADDFETFLEVGTLPGLRFEDDVSLGADLLLNYRGVSAGPGFGRVKKVRLSIDKHTAVAIRRIMFRNWYQDLEDEDYLRRIDRCLDALESPSVYLVSESFVVSNATYRLYSETGAEISLKTPELGDLLEFEPEFSYGVTSDGTLTVKEPVVLAIRQVIRLDGGLQALATPGGEESISGSADALLDKWFLNSTQ